MTNTESNNDSSTRLQNLIISLKLNGLRFAQAIGVSQSFVSSMANGRSKVSRAVIDRIGKAFPRVNIHWLITGQGEMYLAEITKSGPSIVAEDVGLYQKSKKSTIFLIENSDDALRQRLGSNLEVARTRWGLKKNELFRLLMPGVPKQTVTNYYNGTSQPPLIALVRLEALSGISMAQWLIREISPDEIPPDPLDGAPTGDPIIAIKHELQALLERLG